MSNAIFLILGGPKSRKHTLFHVEKCVILHFSGGPDARRLSKTLSFPWGKQYFLRKSGNPENRDRVVRVGAKIMILAPPPGGLAFLSDGGGPRANSLMSGYGGGGGLWFPLSLPAFPPPHTPPPIHPSLTPYSISHRVNSDSDITQTKFVLCHLNMEYGK